MNLSNMQPISREADELRSRASSGLVDSQVSINADDVARKIYPVLAFRDKVMKGYVFLVCFIPH